ncbi:AMP-binding protein [Nannocystis sp. ILAH1]|uniref:phenylacetate--CoA ligase family protein n=1 Tax=unclassified Nannocystis TaxID=2627009 RepID=UPI00226F6540|nr:MULTISPECIES: AMP-binding protein [unclassified Nannocystis]MCY0989612.1 AMP-binding protein [Nannocystis sp. ILAH1]MCY1071288.1 AMP-binding protein [Nannocystis sp. RBIL2]
MHSSFSHNFPTIEAPDAIHRHLSGSKDVDSLSADEMVSYQTESLTAIVRRAYDKSPFYRAKMEQAGVGPREVQRLDDLRKLPFLTKDELRGKPWQLLACDKRDISLVQVSTGTTGGKEIYMMYTRRDHLLPDLALRYSKLFAVGPGDVCLNALPYEMSAAGLAFHKTFMDGQHATVLPVGKGGAYSTPAKTITVMEDLRPNVVATSPSWAIVLAEEAAQRGFDPKSLHLKKMWLTGEGCSPAFRKRVENAWGTTANFFYGSLECGMLGIECDVHDGYHVPQAHAIVEFVDPVTGAPVLAGEIGEIVVTALLRYDSPLIRFRTGDLGLLEEAPCTCGTMLPRFRMRGRAVDQVRAEGRSVSPLHLEDALMQISEVGNWFEFVVPRSGDGRVKIRCELAEGVQPSSSLIEAIVAKMRAATGLSFDLELEDHMPRPTSKATRVVHA